MGGWWRTSKSSKGGNAKTHNDTTAFLIGSYDIDIVT